MNSALNFSIRTVVRAGTREWGKKNKQINNNNSNNNNNKRKQAKNKNIYNLSFSVDLDGSRTHNLQLRWLAPYALTVRPRDQTLNGKIPWTVLSTLPGQKSFGLFLSGIFRSIMAAAPSSTWPGHRTVLNVSISLLLVLDTAHIYTYTVQGLKTGNDNTCSGRY